MSALQMSLFHVFTNSFTLWSDAYECPPNEKVVYTARPLLGSIFLFFGVSFILLYIPCFLAIIQKMRRTPVYQIMFALAIFDILSLSVNSVCTGIFEILGISFCHYPLAIFCLGAIAGGSWMAGCLACILLAIERCVEINSQFPLEFLFRKRVFPIVRLFMFCYSVYSLGFTKAIVFSLEFSCWFFDPMIGKNPELYHSHAHTLNNFMVGTSTTLLYFYISYHLIFKFGYATSMWMYKTKRQILFQAIALCVFHSAAASFYVYMQFIKTTPLLIIISQFVWQWSSGAVCLTYLIFNRTIRNMVLKMVIPKRIRKKVGLHVGIEEHIALEVATNSGGIAVVNAVGAMIQYDNFMSN